MKFYPEEPLEGVPAAPAGRHLMQIVRFEEDVETKWGETKDVVAFVGDVDGVNMGATLWIAGPGGRRKDGTISKGNLFMYRRLAEALGQDALAKYREVDANGHSCFTPAAFQRRWVWVDINDYGIKDFEEVDAQTLKRLEVPVAPAAPAKQDQWEARPAAAKHQPLDDDDIPF